MEKLGNCKVVFYNFVDWDGGLWYKTDMLLRRRYLERIRPYYESELIKVITGIRRCGKSVLLSQIRDEIVAVHPEAKIIYLNFEDYGLREYWDDPAGFNRYVTEAVIGEKEKAYLFFDEIQHLKEYEAVLASMKATLNVSIFVTGSNSSLLSGSLASYLTGRVKEFRIRPFSYAEVLGYRKENGLEMPKDPINDYLLFGGLPMRFSLAGLNDASPEDAQYDLIGNIFQSIIEKDVMPSIKPRQSTSFMKFTKFVTAQSGNLISMGSIDGYLSAYSEKLSKPTLYLYIEQLCKAFLLEKADRYDLYGKKVLAYVQKYYAADPAFIAIAKGGDKKNGLSHVFETVIFNEMRDRGYQVYTGKANGNREIDFVCSRGEEKLYIQCALSLENPETREREFRAFSVLRDNYPRYVISADKDDFSHDGIKHINAEDFFLGGQI